MTERRPTDGLNITETVDYLTLIDRWTPFEQRERWFDLGDLLAHRPGWHPSAINQQELAWLYGAFGGGLLVITAEGDGTWHCFDYHADDDNTRVAPRRGDTLAGQPRGGSNGARPRHRSLAQG